MTDEPKEVVKPAPGIQFATELTDTHGEFIYEATPVTAEQLEQLAATGDAAELRRAIAKLAEGAKKRMTLAKACEMALDTKLKADESEGLKKMLRRGALIENIKEASESLVPLVLSGKTIGTIQDRVAGTFTAASFVRRVCLLLDPNTSAED